MKANTVYPHLTIDKNGQARIGKTRYKVLHLAAEHYQHGWTAEELMRQHPDLRPEEVYAALTYFYDHHDAMFTENKDSFATSAANRPVQPFSRDDCVAGQRRGNEWRRHFTWMCRCRGLSPQVCAAVAWMT